MHHYLFCSLLVFGIRINIWYNYSVLFIITNKHLSLCLRKIINNYSKNIIAYYRILSILKQNEKQ